MLARANQGCSKAQQAPAAACFVRVTGTRITPSQAGARLGPGANKSTDLNYYQDLPLGPTVTYIRYSCVEGVEREANARVGACRTLAARPEPWPGRCSDLARAVPVQTPHMPVLAVQQLDAHGFWNRSSEDAPLRLTRERARAAAVCGHHGVCLGAGPAAHSVTRHAATANASRASLRRFTSAWAIFPVALQITDRPARIDSTSGIEWMCLSC